MDIDTTGYIIDEAEASVERYQLEEHGYQVSGPIIIGEVNIGFLAVQSDEEKNVQEAVVVVVEG